MIVIMSNPLQCFFGIRGRVALDGNPGMGHNTLLLRLIPGDLQSAWPHRYFYTTLIVKPACQTGKQFVPYL